MGLDYSGIPSFSRERDLFLKSITRDALEPFVEEDTEAPIEDRLFDDVARTFLKGEALKEALGDMDKAGFIPVEPLSKVIASLQRLDPKSEDYTVITFGMFKEACEYLHDSSTNLNEEFLGTFNVIDPNLQDSTITTTHKSSTNDGGDWISAFLIGGSAIAGLMIAGYLNDLYISAVGKATAPDNEFKQWGAQGLFVAVALLIELGVTYLAILEQYKDSSSVSQEVKDAFKDLDKDPAKRKVLLDDAGYNYDALLKNQKHNDYNAVKEYSIEYIKRQQDQSKYHHWVSWMSVVSNQGMLKHSLAMAPTFSKKWYDFSENKEEDEDSTLEQAADKTISTFNNGLKSYISSLLSLSNDTYDNLYATFNFQLDERILCCMLYFLGPLDTSTLKLISKILKLMLLRVNIDIGQLLAFLLDETLTSILNMAATYASKLISEIYENIMKIFFSLPENDLMAILKLCIGIDWLFKIIDILLREIIDFVDTLLDQLRSCIQLISGKTKGMSSSIADNRVILTIASMLDTISAKIEEANAICAVKTEDKDLPFIDNYSAADAAIEFVSIEMPKLFPVMKMSEENSRKYFRNISGFNTSMLDIEIPGTDSLGKQKRPLAFSDPVTDCANESNASESIALGRKLAELFKAK